MSDPQRVSSNAPQGPPVPVGPDKKAYKVRGSTFEVDNKYDVVKAIGYGAYGLVCSAKDTEKSRNVAIKKIPKIFDDLVDGKRILREIKLLQYLNHENVLNVLDLMRPREGYATFRDLYMVSDLMETDLHHVIKSKQKLSDEHVQYFVYQMLRALRYIHSAEVIHRDLKPGNLLVNSNCDLKLCDFGLARGGVAENAPPQELTDYVVTRWYRPPELLLMCNYSHPVDLWSTGCITVELLNRKALFPGKDYIHQLTLVSEVVAVPPEDQLSFVSSAEALRYLRGMPPKKVKPMRELLPPTASDAAVDFVSKLLTFDPSKRMSAVEAMKHPYLAHLFDPADDVVYKAKGGSSLEQDRRQWEFDQRDLKEVDLRDLFWKEVLNFHPDPVQQ
jgi:serine/threonine protein kinase